MPKHKSRNSKRISTQDGIVSGQKVDTRVDYEILTDNRRKELDDIIIERNKNFKSKNIIAKVEDTKKDKQTISNKSFQSIKNGFWTTDNKDKYIKDNRNHIKSLPVNQQRNLIRMFLQHL